MSRPDFPISHSNPQKGRRQAERVSLWWLREFEAALRRGNETARHINDLHALDARLRREAWTEPPAA